MLAALWLPACFVGLPKPQAAPAAFERVSRKSSWSVRPVTQNWFEQVARKGLKRVRQKWFDQFVNVFSSFSGLLAYQFELSSTSV